MSNLFFWQKCSAKKEQCPLRLLLPSFLGVALCIVCITSTTWAWFATSAASTANTIQSAAFDVVVKDSADSVIAIETDGSYQLGQGTYSVQMSKTGNAAGYFDFTVGATQYRTAAITANTPITIKIQNTGTSPIYVFFMPSWKTPDGTTIGNSQVVMFHAGSPSDIDTITDGETIIVGEAAGEPAGT